MFKKCALVFVICLVSAFASADTTYSNFAAWNTATGGNSTLVDLSPFSAGPGWTYAAPQFTASNVTFSTPVGNYLWVGNDVNGNLPAQYGVLGNNDFSGGIHIALPTNTFAISFDATDWYGGNLQVTLADGTVETLLNNGGSVFFGFTSDSAISSVQVNAMESNGYGNYPYIGNVRYDQDSPVPEPGSMVLLGSGLLGLAGAVRRKLVA